MKKLLPPHNRHKRREARKQRGFLKTRNSPWGLKTSGKKNEWTSPPPPPCTRPEAQTENGVSFPSRNVPTVGLFPPFFPRSLHPALLHILCYKKDPSTEQAERFPRGTESSSISAAAEECCSPNTGDIVFLQGNPWRTMRLQLIQSHLRPRYQSPWGRRDTPGTKGEQNSLSSAVSGTASSRPFRSH